MLTGNGHRNLDADISQSSPIQSSTRHSTSSPSLVHVQYKSNLTYQNGRSHPCGKADTSLSLGQYLPKSRTTTPPSANFFFLFFSLCFWFSNDSELSSTRTATSHVVLPGKDKEKKREKERKEKPGAAECESVILEIWCSPALLALSCAATWCIQRESMLFEVFVMELCCVLTTSVEFLYALYSIVFYSHSVSATTASRKL